MKKLLSAIALLFFASDLNAATYWVSTGGGAASCAAASGASDPGQYRTLHQGEACLSGGDTLKLKGGTYDAAIMSLPSGSAGAPTIVEPASSSDTVTLRSFRPGSGNFITLRGNNWPTSRNFKVDMAGQEFWADGNSGVNALVISGNNWVIQDVEVKGGTNNNISSTNLPTNLQLLNLWVHNSGVPNCNTTSPPVCHGFYSGGDNILIDGGLWEDNTGYAIHFRPVLTNSTVRNVVIRNNGSTGLGLVPTGESGASGNNKFYNNIIYGNTGYGILMAGSDADRVYNNTVYQNGNSGISIGDWMSNTIVRNNIGLSNTNAQIANDCAAGTCAGITFDHNVTSGTPSNIFVDTTTGNFSIKSGVSTVIDQGIAAIATGVTACANGSAPDIGAIETLPQPTAIVDGTTFTITITNNCASQMLPATSVTGFSVRKNSSADAFSGAVNRSGNNTFVGTLSAAFVGGDSCDFSYAQSSGNAKSDNNIGDATSNQEIFDFTNISCTNQTGGASGSVHLSHWRWYLLQGASDTAWLGKCAEDSSNCTVAPGAKLWGRLKVRNNSGTNFAPFNFRARYRYNAGSYVNLTSAYVNAIKALGSALQLGTVLSEGTILTQDLLTSNETNVSSTCGVAIRSDTSIPSLALNNSTECELAVAIDISTAAVAGDTYEICPYTDAGAALTCSTPAKITIGNYQGATGN